MFSRLVSLYRPYMLGIRTLLQNALLPALTGTPSPQSTAQLLDSLASSSPYGVQHMYKSLDAAVVVLLMAREMDPRLSSSNDSARAFYSQLAELQQYIFIMGRAKSSAQHNFGNKQVIVLEGFGQSGKSLLLRALVARFGHTAGCALDEVWPDMRAIFAGMPEAVSCAFDFVKCYFLARRISEVEDGQTVFVENYYHSSCARTACLDQSRDPRSLPEVAFYWPTDLPQPNLVGFRCPYLSNFIYG